MRRPRIEFTRPSLREIFERNEGRLVHKVDHYFPIYERHLERFRGTSPNVLEIGVAQGGSIDMWHEYFGRGTTTTGIDIEPRSATLAGPRRRIVVGDQGDAELLTRVAEQAGPFDVVIDDGSHLPEHQVLALETLWDHLTSDGVMIVEDLCTNYWPEYGGGVGKPHTFIERVKPLLDDVNAFNSREDDFTPSRWTRTLTGLHVYDSIIVFERGVHAPLTTTMTGRPVFDTINGLPADEQITPEHQAQIDAMNRPWRRVRRALRRPRATLDAVASRRRPQG